MLQLLRLLLTLFLAVPAQAERNLPANLQVDLLFPRDGQTYAPTQWFPIVLGIQNLDALWPFEMHVNLDIRSLDSWKNNSSGGRAPWQFQHLQINSDLFPSAVGPDPGKQFLYHPVVNMTNGTTDSFMVRWGIMFAHRCFGNDSLEDGATGWTSGTGIASTRAITFSTAPGGQTPDVASALDACAEGGENTTTALRVTDVRQPDRTWPRLCPVFETDVRPERCAYRHVSRELAANVSASILQKMQCNGGTWQDITAPCMDEPKKNGMASLGGLQSGWISWAPVLGVALAAYCHGS